MDLFRYRFLVVHYIALHGFFIVGKTSASHIKNLEVQLCCHHQTLSRSDCSSFIAAKKRGQHEMVSMNLVPWIHIYYVYSLAPILLGCVDSGDSGQGPHPGGGPGEHWCRSVEALGCWFRMEAAIEFFMVFPFSLFDVYIRVSQLVFLHHFPFTGFGSSQSLGEGGRAVP